MSQSIVYQAGIQAMKWGALFGFKKAAKPAPRPVPKHIADIPRPPIHAIQAEARVWADTLRRAEATIGDRDMAVVADDPDVHEAIDLIDFAALREFLEIVGHHQLC